MNYQLFDAGDNKVLLGPECISCKKGEDSTPLQTQYYIIRRPKEFNTNLNLQNNYHIVVNEEIGFTYYRTLSERGSDPFLNALRERVPPYEYEVIGAEATHRGTKLFLSDKDFLVTGNVMKEDGSELERIELFLSPNEVYNSKGYKQNSIKQILAPQNEFDSDEALIDSFRSWKAEAQSNLVEKFKDPVARGYTYKVAGAVLAICAIILTLMQCSGNG